MEALEYYNDVVECDNCGYENVVDIISEYDPHQGETFNSLVVGQICVECGHKLKL